MMDGHMEGWMDGQMLFHLDSCRVLTILETVAKVA